MGFVHLYRFEGYTFELSLNIFHYCGLWERLSENRTFSVYKQGGPDGVCKFIEHASLRNIANIPLQSKSFPGNFFTQKIHHPAVGHILVAFSCILAFLIH